MQKVATVTGAARGIGLGTVRRFLVDGWRVALLDIDEETLNRSAADLHTDSVLPICCDVADAAGVTKAFSAVAQTFGRLDVLVNNAGIAIFKPILNITYEEWSRVLAVNLTGPFLCTQAAAPLIRDSGGGAIVNITSISGLRASTLRTAYGTSKAGLAHLTQQQAIELASLGIRVNAVAPGPVDTAMAKAATLRKFVPLIMMPFHLTATDWSRSLPKQSSSFAAIEPAISRGRRLRWTVDLRLQALAYQRCVPTSIPNSARAKISRVSRGDDAAPAPAYTKTYLATRSRKPISAKWCRPLRLVACTSAPEIPRCA